MAHRLPRFGISIHAPRTGSDWTVGAIRRSPLVFQSTLPARGATSAIPQVTPSFLSFQSTLPARGATRRQPRTASLEVDFNPRSPHGERHAAAADGNRPGKISIHAPRTGSDLFFRLSRFLHIISIHAPRTGSDAIGSKLLQVQTISIHAPRTGSDFKIFTFRTAQILFQSTLPARGATMKRGI